MGATQPQISTDGRARAEKLSRRQALSILRDRGINVSNENIPLGTGFPDGYRGPTLLKIMENEGIDPNDPFPEVQWRQVHGKDENGLPVVNDVPIRPVHASAKESINYDKEIAERAAQQKKVIDEQEAQIATSDEMIGKLMARLDALEKNTIPAERATVPQLKKLCKDRGLDVTELKSKKALLEALDAASG